MYKTVEEIEKALSDRSYAEAVMSHVSKGSKGNFSYVPWNETAKLLTRIFGTFGWSARIVGSHSDSERGIYRTDLELTVYAVYGNGVVVSKSLPGTGGCVASPLSHDDAMKSSRSDALSVAAKSLGDAFGLYLYDKGDPARTEGARESTRTQETTNNGADLGHRPSEKQLAVLVKAGYPEAQVAKMNFKTWKSCVDAIFAKAELPVRPAKAAPAKSNTNDELEEWLAA